MRKLNTLDLLKVTSMFGKIGKKVEISEGMTEQQIGLTFFASALEHAETELKELLAGVAEMTVEEFEKMPFDYPLDVIEHLIENEDMQGFLQRVKGLIEKLSKK